MSAPGRASRVTRLVVISEVRLYRDGLVQSLAHFEGIEVVGAARSGEDAATIVRLLRPDVAVLDISNAASVSLVREVMNASPDTRVVAFAVSGDESDVIAYAEAGISGYVPRDGAIADLVEAVESAARGEVICSPRVAAEAFRRLAALSANVPRNSSPLTAREHEIVALIDQGLSNKQIARRLYITLATVKNHVHNVLEKLQVERRGEAAAKLRWSASSQYLKPRPPVRPPAT